MRLLHRFHRHLAGSAGNSANRRCGKYPCPLAAACFTKPATTLSGIIGIADRVRAAEEHLETDVRNALRAAAAAAPTDLRAENASRCRTSRRPTSPARTAPACGAPRASAHRQHVVGAHARGHERLVRVAERRVGDQQPLLLAASTRRISSARASSSRLRVPGRRRLLVVVRGPASAGERLLRACNLWRAGCR